MDSQPLLPLGLAARYLRVPARWLRAEAEAGRIPHLRADTALLFDVATVEALLIERARQLPDTGRTPEGVSA
jgi:hypothetical protein